MVNDKIYISELEAEVLSVFVKRRILEDTAIVDSLEYLVEKLKGGKDGTVTVD